MLAMLARLLYYYFKKKIMNFKKMSVFLIGVLALNMFLPMGGVMAADSSYKGQVVINEVAWMGSADASGDEYIELYNDSLNSIDISGWKITDDDTSDYVITTGTIPSKGYFLIEDSEDAVTTRTADAIIGVSLANTGDKLELKDALGNTVDLVGGLGGMWYAGNSTTKATMERIAVNGADDATNWQDCASGSGDQASAGSNILGTPGTVNSGSTTTPSGVPLTLNTTNTTLAPGVTFNVALNAGTVSDFFSYGVDLTYDATVLEYQSAAKGTFLNYFANDPTSFQVGLLNNQPGRLIIGEARTVSPKTGISGSGEMFDVTFKVVGSDGDSSQIALDQSKVFLGGLSGDIPYSTSPLNINVSSGSSTTVNPVTNLVAQEGDNRYEIKLTWVAASGGADSYKVFRKGVDGTYLLMDTVSATSFVDKDGVSKGGNILISHDYEYQVVSVKGGNESTAVTATGKDTRGIKSDIDKNDRVDGRDLDLLARLFGLDLTFAEFNPRADLTYSGDINGSDLIDLGVDWAKTYTPTP